MFKIDKKLTHEQLEAIDMLTRRFYDARMTDQAIADKLGISRTTLHNWKKIPEFNEEFIKQSREINRSTLPVAMAYISRTLNNPRVKDSSKIKLVELILKANGELKDVQESEITVKQAEDIDNILADFKSLGADTAE